MRDDSALSRNLIETRYCILRTVVELWRLWDLLECLWKSLDGIELFLRRRNLELLLRRSILLELILMHLIWISIHLVQVLRLEWLFLLSIVLLLLRERLLVDRRGLLLLYPHHLLAKAWRLSSTKLLNALRSHCLLIKSLILLKLLRLLKALYLLSRYLSHKLIQSSWKRLELILESHILLLWHHLRYRLLISELLLRILNLLSHEFFLILLRKSLVYPIHVHIF